MTEILWFLMILTKQRTERGRGGGGERRRRRRMGEEEGGFPHEKFSLIYLTRHGADSTVIGGRCSGVARCAVGVVPRQLDLA